MLLKILILASCALLASLVYRTGGMAKKGKWYDFILNTKTRDIGVPICVTFALLGLCFDQPVVQKHPVQFGISLFFSFGLLFGSLTTYWKRKGTEAKWYNWLLTGLGYGLSILPIIVFFTDWIGFIVRLIVLSVLVMLWSVFIGRDWLEECGRGLLIIITLPLLLIGLKKKR